MMDVPFSTLKFKWDELVPKIFTLAYKEKDNFYLSNMLESLPKETSEGKKK